MLKLLVIVSSLLVLANAEYSKLVWSACDAPGMSPALIFKRAEVTPMPVVHPGSHALHVTAFGRGLKGKAKIDINIVRGIAGLNLPIRCYIVDGFYVGSCSYNDFCKTILNEMVEITPNNCPEGLSTIGIDCRCPFNMIDRPDINDPLTVDVDGLDVPDFSKTIINFFANGDFDTTVKFSDSLGYYGCWNVKWTMKQKSPTGK